MSDANTAARVLGGEHPPERILQPWILDLLEVLHQGGAITGKTKRACIAAAVDRALAEHEAKQEQLRVDVHVDGRRVERARPRTFMERIRRGGRR